MRVVDLIIKKRDGQELSKAEIIYVIEAYTQGSIPDYQLSALMMAIYFQGMTTLETANLTLAMTESGDIIDLSLIPGKKVDKHSTGGVGDKTSLVLGPLVAAAGVNVAKMSGRGLGHTGGTIDKLEAIEGFQVELTEADFIKQVQDIHLAIIGQTGDLTPADKKLYALRDVTGTVESIPLIASSIMSKKIAAGTDIICLDVKVGDGAFMKTLEEGRILAKTMVDIGKHLDKQVYAFLTNMDEPLGHNIGNALEIAEVIETLKGQGPEDLTQLCLEIGSHMLQAAGVTTTLIEAKEQLQQLLANGKALAKFYEFIAAQHGNPQFVLPQAKHKIAILAPKSGYIAKIKTLEVGMAAMLVGAGRATKEDRIDPAVGIELCSKVGSYVARNDVLAYLYHNSLNDQAAYKQIVDAYVITEQRVEKSPLIYEIMT